MREVITNKDADEFKLLFKNVLAEKIRGLDSISLAMSGGIDSMSVFFSLIELGVPFECYTFYQDGFMSDDLLSSRRYCKKYNIKLNEIKLSSKVDDIYADIVSVLPFCGKKILKTKVETLRPLMHMFKRSNHLNILNGSSADDYQPYKRKVNVDLNKYGEKYCVRHRLSVDDKPDAFDVLSRNMAKSFGVNFINAYADKSIESFFLKFKLSVLLKPHKHLVVRAFRDEFRQIGGFRRHSSYQINSKTAYYHSLLLSSKYNKNKHKGIIGLYNEIHNRCIK